MDASIGFVRVGLVALVSARIAATAVAQETTCVSTNASGAVGNGPSSEPSISADGRFVVFSSEAMDLVNGDSNGCRDVFIHVRSTPITERVSLDSSGNQGNGVSVAPQLSSDGRFVLFLSTANNFVVGDTNNFDDAFVRDLSTGITERVSVDSTGKEANGDTGSIGRNDDYSRTSISAHGRFVAFSSGASNLVIGDTNGKYDVFVHDRSTGITERVSVSSASGEADGDSFYPSLSADGRFVAFGSWATNLVARDSKGYLDIFVHDRWTGITSIVSASGTGGAANQNSVHPSISSDGNAVAFRSLAWDLVLGDTNGWDIFVRDRSAGRTELVSVDSLGGQANDDCDDPMISSDGRLVAFQTWATNLGDLRVDLGHRMLYSKGQVVIHDRSSGRTDVASVSSSGEVARFGHWFRGFGGAWSPMIAGDVNAVAFVSAGDNLYSGDFNVIDDVFVHEFCFTDASWSNYGPGFPGTHGIPSFTSRQNPVIGTTVTLDLGNSAGNATAGLLFIGVQRTKIHSGWGGDLLVVPAIVLPIALPGGGVTLSGAIPLDWTFCGSELDLQAIEADPGAASGVSFTSGLELILGR
jgi:Tol biopolymer transport system component